MAYVFTRIGEQTDLAQLQAELGSSAVPLGPVQEMADTIDESGPFLLADPSGHDRDLYLQHIGEDPLTGWNAFGVRTIDAQRDCYVEWQPDAREFLDNCTGEVFVETGDGLPEYAVNIDGQGNLSVDLG